MPFFDALPVDWIEPGETATVNIDGFPIAVANVLGEFFAFQNLCPHQGTTLGGQRLRNNCEITCPQHSSRYDVRTGACLAPAEGDGFDQDLMTFPVRVIDGVVQVSI